MSRRRSQMDRDVCFGARGQRFFNLMRFFALVASGILVQAGHNYTFRRVLACPRIIFDEHLACGV